MKARMLGSCLLAALIVSGCNECENGYKIKTEYKYVGNDERWHKDAKDKFFDGAVRVSTWTFKYGRMLELRCFRASVDHAEPKLDVRYAIEVPMLKRVVPDLDKAGPIEMILTVDDIPIGSIKVTPLSHDHGVSFLGNINVEIIDQLLGATESIVAMPRQGFEKLDDPVEFGVAELVKYIEPVKKACEVKPPDSVPAPPIEKGPTDKA